ncbi:hypothetical protein [Bacteroides sp.]|uniref:hypothetical protein n=1 Tax=Bacteroides sp. TaxID=29523 RepID=UPI002589F6E6|nr:hypothetical protein [Bacteroides sp.]
MICRYYLMIGSEKVDINSQSCIDVSSMIANLDDIKLSYNRVDYNGVIRKCGSTIEFVAEAREALIELYNESRLKSSGAFAVYSMTDTWTFKPVFECPLDFSTFNYDSYTAKIGCVDNSVAAKLKANNNTKYEIAVSRIKETKQLKFDALRLVSYANFVFTGDSVEGESYTMRENIDTGGMIYYMPPVSYSQDETFYNSNIVLHDQQEGFSGLWTSIWTHNPNENRTSYFLEAVSDIDLDIDFRKFSVKVINIETGEVGVSVHVYKIPVAGNPIELFTGTSIKKTIHLLKGEKLQLALSRIGFNVTFGVSTFYFYDLGKIQWISTGEPVNVDIVRPESVLNGLLENMGLSWNVKGVIQPGNEVWFNSIFILAGESIRDFQNPVIYTSFADFCKAMETIAGLVYIIETVTQDESIATNSIGISDYDIADLELDADPVKIIDYVPSDDEFSTTMTMPEGVYLVEVIYNKDIYYWFYGLGSDGLYYFIFDNMDKYEDFAEGGVIDNNILLDSVTQLYYLTDNSIQDIKPFVFESIDYSRYNHLARFGGGIIDGGSITIEVTSYEGNVDTNDIYFLKTQSKFVYKSLDNKYYSVFSNSESYQLNNRLNPRAVFVDDSDSSQCYFAVCNNILIEYSGIVPNLPEWGGNVGPVETGSYIIKFVPRESVFSSMRVLKLDAIGEPSYSVASESIYSSINVGYDKQDYDLGNNGKDEFNFNIHYTTGLSIKNQTLDFICPYRADSYGMQELFQKRGDAVSDTDSDNNTFLVYTTEKTSEYVLDRSIPITGVFLDTVFNAALSPFAMIANNKSYLASYTDKLAYASSDIMKSITIDGNGINDTQVLGMPLFLPGTIRVKTSYMKLPESWNGYVEFTWNGQVYKGYVKSVDISLFHEEVLEYELIEC